jgi:hypothetical protein
MAYRYVVDTQSGTYFDADHAVVVSDQSFNIDDYNSILDAGSDAEIIEVAKQVGIDVNYHIESSVALTSIARLMSGREWNADTLSEIAEILRDAGRNVDEVA